MKIKQIPLIKSDERGYIYNCGKSGFIIRKEGSISANHTHQEHEIIYLVRGKIELTISNETQIVEAPIMFEIESNVYHKLLALTDIELVIDRSDDK